MPPVGVLAVFRPRDGRAAQLEGVIATHLPLLRDLGLATDRPEIAARTADRSHYLEVFEWVSPEAIEAAHAHPRVHELWRAYEEACTYATLADLPNAGAPFAGFEPLEAAPGAAAPGHLVLACIRVRSAGGAAGDLTAAGSEARKTAARESARLEAAMRRHLPLLQELKLATARPGYILRAGGGCVVEVLEWSSAAAPGQAAANPRVRELWAEYEAVAVNVTLGELPGAGEMFPGYEVVEP